VLIGVAEEDGTLDEEARGSAGRLIERTVEGMTAGGGIGIEAAVACAAGFRTPLGVTELLESPTTDDCREVLVVVETPLGFATGLNIGPPFSVIRINEQNK
jgi:hypothetical protein